MKKIKIIGAVISCVFLLISIHLITKMHINANTDTKEQQRALVKTIEAFYNQGQQLQYDSYRKQLNATPEDATSQHTVYTVCSGITYQTYYQALGVKIPTSTQELLAYANDNQNTDYVLAYYSAGKGSYGKNQNKTTITPDQALDDYENLFNEWLEIVQPGDIFVITGHAIFIKEVDKANKSITTLEAIYGGRYDFENHVDKVDSKFTLGITKFKNRLKSYSKKSYDEMAIIRPTKNGNTYLKQSGTSRNYTYTETTYAGITKAAQSRLKYENIDIEKTININDGLSQNKLVDLGETITYKITIKNNSSSTYKDFKVVENIDSKVTASDLGGGTLNSNKTTLTWNVSKLKAGQTKTITYSVKVKNSDSYLGEILLSTGKVDNIATSKIETLIGKKFTKDERNKIINAYNSLKNNSSIERKFINDIYLKAFNVDLGLSNLSNLDIMEYDAKIDAGGGNVLSVKRAKIKDTSVTKYIYQNFYGLRLFGGVSTRVNSNRDCPNSYLARITLQWKLSPTYELNDRARDLTPDMLVDGDIILMYTSDSPIPDNTQACPNEVAEDRSYIYINNTLIRKTSSNQIQEIKGTELNTFLRNIIGDNYIILRPSLAIDQNNNSSNNTNNQKPNVDNSTNNTDNQKPSVDNSTNNTDDQKPSVDNSTNNTDNQKPNANDSNKNEQLPNINDESAEEESTNNEDLFYQEDNISKDEIIIDNKNNISVNSETAIIIVCSIIIVSISIYLLYQFIKQKRYKNF